MTSVLLISTFPEPVRKQYYDHIRAAFPELTVNVVDHHSKVDPYIASTNVLLTFGTMMAYHVLRDAPNLKWIQALGTGTDGIDDLPSLRPEILLTSMRGIHGPPMSEAALAAMLALSRKLHRTMRNQERHAWERPQPTLLDGKTVGIFGLGIIGSALVPKCKALGMSVIGVDPLNPDVPGLDRNWSTLGGAMSSTRRRWQRSCRRTGSPAPRWTYSARNRFPRITLSGRWTTWSSRLTWAAISRASHFLRQHAQVSRRRFRKHDQHRQALA